MKPFAHSHLMAASHHVACVAATMRLTVAVLNREAVNGCRCSILEGASGERAGREVPGREGAMVDMRAVKVAAGECQRASEACLAAHRDRDLARLRECNKVFVSRVAKVHAAVHGAFLRNGGQMGENEGAPRGTRWVRM